MKGYVKRRFLVGGMQNRLLTIGSIHYLAVVVTFLLVIFLPLAIRLSGDSTYDPMVSRAAHEFMAFHARVWPALLLMFVLLILHDILVTHRIAGPLHRLRQNFEDIGRGDLSINVKVRESDYLQDEAAAIDKMVVRLRARVEAIKEAHKGAVGAAHELEHAAEAESRDRFNNALRALRDDLDNAGAELDHFIVTNEEESRGPVPEAATAREPEPAV